MRGRDWLLLFFLAYIPTCLPTVTFIARASLGPYIYVPSNARGF